MIKRKIGTTRPFPVAGGGQMSPTLRVLDWSPKLLASYNEIGSTWELDPTEQQQQRVWVCGGSLFIKADPLLRVLISPSFPARVLHFFGNLGNGNHLALIFGTINTIEFNTIEKIATCL
jgi:hypothetical protein